MKVALHVCCAICAAGAAERLLNEGFDVEGFFYNPNLYPQEEYLRRLDNAKIVADKLGFTLVEGTRDFDNWNREISGLENEPEGGSRCRVCMNYRLKKTFLFMKDQGCDVFTTTLTMGRNKPGNLISNLGSDIGGDRFLVRDFKKRAGIHRSGELAAIWGLYRQHYCGCKYSLT